jgi:Tfp pilus assembly protein FimT
MYLSNTNEPMELVLKDPVTTNQIQWMSIYNNITSNNTIITPSFTNQGLSNNTTPVTIVFPPTGVTKKEVIHLFIFNNDTVAQTVIIRKKVGANTYILYKNSVLINNTLEWSKNTGWQIN